MTDLYDNLTKIDLTDGFKYAFKNAPSAKTEISFPDLSQIKYEYFDLSKRKERRRLLEWCNAKEIIKTESGFYVVGNDGYARIHENKDMLLWSINWGDIKRVYKKGPFVFADKETEKDD